MATYKTVLFYQSGEQRTLQTGLSLAQAQAICQDKETSSKTCTKSHLKQRTRKRGEWFVGYTEEKGQG